MLSWNERVSWKHISHGTTKFLEFFSHGTTKITLLSFIHIDEIRNSIKL